VGGTRHRIFIDACPRCETARDKIIRRARVGRRGDHDAAQREPTQRAEVRRELAYGGFVRKAQQIFVARATDVLRARTQCVEQTRRGIACGLFDAREC